MSMRIFITPVLAYFLLTAAACTYDSTPPGDERINDGKPLLMIDIQLTTAEAQRLVQIQYTDLAGTTTLQTAAEKTDASGRLLYPLYMTRGTRTGQINAIIIDQNGNGTFGDAGDLTLTGTPVTVNFAADSDIIQLNRTAAAFP